MATSGSDKLAVNIVELCHNIGARNMYKRTTYVVLAQETRVERILLGVRIAAIIAARLYDTLGSRYQHSLG